MRMHVSTNADILVARWRNRATKLTPAIRRVEQQTMDYARQQAIKYSSNRAYVITNNPNYAPYRKGGGKGVPPLPPYQINIQGRNGSEHFADKWFVNTQETPKGFTSSIWNAASYAKYMRGTVKMIQRPILSKVGEDVRKFRIKLEEEAYVKVIQAK